MKNELEAILSIFRLVFSRPYENSSPGCNLMVDKKLATFGGRSLFIVNIKKQAKVVWFESMGVCRYSNTRF
jgi:hypothetical protein